MKVTACLLLLAVIGIVSGANRCVWVRGIIRCNHNTSRAMNVEVRLYDKDGLSIFQIFDPDDMMGITFTEEDGSFQLDGCGSDFNWLPGVENEPDPFIKIRHFCNSERGETIEIPLEYKWVPDSQDLGVIELDRVELLGTTSTLPEIIRIVEDTTPVNPKFSTPKGQVVHITHPDEIAE